MTAPTHPFVSVIIPTYNRSARLPATVESFIAQKYPPDRFEIVLVDNASTDDTAQVVARLVSDFTRVRRMTEKRRGAHFARNAGAAVSLGEILYFTDDDMIADPGLLANIVAPFTMNCGVGSATGKVLPSWETEPPVWVLQHCRNALLSLNDRGEALMICDADPGVFSCHQAILRDVFFRAGGFNPDTNAGEFVGDNETGLNIKVRQLGYRFAYVGESVTHHMIPASRMSQDYLNSRFADQGYCDSYTAYKASQMGKGRLATRVIAHTLLAGVTSAKAVVRRAANDSRWRLDLAKFFYYRNRARYDTRLIRSDRWRKFVMRWDWLRDDLGADGVPRGAAGNGMGTP